ncbi:hypothetical protein UFO1_0136 [Pelosinus sp. UFO1]|nr:hypothetical protein UFO1_0136 [Pelosinus sp. UFO1]
MSSYIEIIISCKNSQESLQEICVFIERGHIRLDLGLGFFCIVG